MANKIEKLVRLFYTLQAYFNFCFFKKYRNFNKKQKEYLKNNYKPKNKLEKYLYSKLI
jgi:hypothetical protein